MSRVESTSVYDSSVSLLMFSSASEPSTRTPVPLAGAASAASMLLYERAMPPMFASTYTSWRTGLPLASAPVTVKCQASLPPRASGRTMRPWPSVLAPLTRESLSSRKNIRCSAAASVTLGVVETDRSVYRVPVVEVTL